MSDVSWTEIVALVRTEQPQLYRAWFEELPSGRIEGGEFRVTVGDPVQAAYLQNDCAAAFSNAFMRLSGRLMPVRFISSTAEARPQVRSQPGARVGPLNPDYTFEQFVVGPSNRLAHASCKAVCVQPGAVYNPLFVHGPSGTGKTHLLQAICTHFERTGGESRAIYLTCETFVNEFIRAIETGGLAAFRDSIRHAEVLVIDDVQFLAGRESSQEELFHTFNVLHQSRRQIVLSADLPPAEIPTLEERLVSRFKWGLVVQVGMPDRETRHAILAKKARLRGVEVPDEILDLVAEQVSSNVRALEGALTKLISETTLGGKPMSIDTARQILAEVEGGGPRLLQVPDIIELVAKHFGLRSADLIGRKRSRSVAHPRQLAIYLARKLTPLSLEEIGSYFGGRDHSTVLHAATVVERERGIEREIADTLAVLTRTILGKRAAG
ncbi:MAG: hypothetical protein AMXMBFR47_14120 [Planctomycetota bacterium]